MNTQQKVLILIVVVSCAGVILLTSRSNVDGYVDLPTTDSARDTSAANVANASSVRQSPPAQAIVTTASSPPTSPTAPSDAQPKAQQVFDTTPPTLETVAAFLEPSGDPKRPVASPSRVMRDKFQAEPVDWNWRANTEPMLQSYFAARPAADAVSTNMSCHTTICEVIVQTQTATDSAGLDSVQETVFGISMQPWWKEFGFKDSQISVGIGPEGKAIALAYFSKNEIVTQPLIK